VAAKTDYEVGFKPFRDELAVIDIPERRPRGDIANYERVKTIGVALNKKRLALLAASSPSS